MRLVGLTAVPAEDRATVSANRRPRNARTMGTVALTAALLAFIQFILIRLDPSIVARPAVLGSYLILFALCVGVSAGFWALWRLRKDGPGLDLYIAFLLAEGVGLALCDLQFSGDYSTYVLILFAVSVLYSAPLGWYVLTFGLSWLILVTGMSLTLSGPFGVTPVAASAVLTIVATASGIILEARRIRTELLTLELERKTREWKEASLRDALTGLRNRRFLFEWMDQQLPAARRRGSPLAVALIDLDHFKTVNDTAGHHAGDQVLREAALWFSQTVRSSDLVVRYGGEEFVVVLPDTGTQEARAVIERCLTAFRTSRVHGWQGQLTFSAGLTVLGPDDDVTSLFQRADELLYRAKSGGRDQIAAG